MRYFAQFPVVIYKDQIAVDITKRVKLLEDAKTHATLFYDYTIKEGESIDQIAHDYYGNPYYFWVIAFVNDMVDLNYDWPLNQIDFQNYLKEKYGSMEAAQSTICHYQRDADIFYVHQKTNALLHEDDWLLLPAGEQGMYEQAEPGEPTIISVDTYDTMEAMEEYYPIYAADWEIERNEAKRKIRLLDFSYLQMAENNLKELLK